MSIGAVGGVDGRGDGTTGDATWVQQQDGGIYGLGETVFASGGDGGYGMSALPSQSYQQQDASMVFPWASNDGAEFGGMPETRGTVMVVQEGIVVVVYSPAHLGEQREGMGWGLTIIVLRYSSR